MPEHRARPNDRSGRERLADGGFTSGLGAIELGRRSWRSVEMRHVDQPRNANARSDPGNALSALDMDVIKSKVSTRRGGLRVSIRRNDVLKKTRLVS